MNVNTEKQREAEELRNQGTDDQEEDETIYEPVVFHSDDYDDETRPILADDDIRTLDDISQLQQFDQAEPVFVNDNDDDSDLFMDRRRQNELETNQLEDERYGPMNFDSSKDDPFPILFSDKRIDVKKPGPRIDVSSRKQNEKENVIV